MSTDEKVDAWMPLWIGAYLADTMTLTTQQHGAYLLLLFAYWRNRGPLNDDDEDLASIVKASPAEWKKLRAKLCKFFTIDNGVWAHGRADKELAAAGMRKAAATAKAVSGGASRWESSDAAERGRHLRAQRLAAARQKGTHTEAEWMAMKAFHRHLCCRCGADGADIVKDHIQPIYQGGSDAIDNIQPLCRSCNASKGPESTDHRAPGWEKAIDAFLDGINKGIRCLPDACPTPSPTPSPSESSDPKGSGAADAPPAVDKSTGSESLKRQAWRDCGNWFVSNGVAEGTAREVIGKVARDYPAVAVEACLAAAKNAECPDPEAYLIATAKRMAGEQRTVPSAEAAKTADYLAQSAEQKAAALSPESHEARRAAMAKLGRGDAGQSPRCAA